MASLMKLSAMPSLTQLYRTGQLVAATGNLLPGNQSLNNKISTVQYDITKLEVDAIVNAANRGLLGGGGVDGAIHRAAGSDLYQECRGLGGCATGSAKITDGYNLPCRKVIHAVGPIYSSREKSEPLLRGCYRTSLQLAADNNCRTIAFSAISTGVYGYPSRAAAAAALDEVRNFLEQPDGDKIDKVIFCNFMDKDVAAYAEALPYIFPATEDDQEQKVSSLEHKSKEYSAATASDTILASQSNLQPLLSPVTLSQSSMVENQSSPDRSHPPETDVQGTRVELADKSVELAVKPDDTSRLSKSEESKSSISNSEGQGDRSSDQGERGSAERDRDSYEGAGGADEGDTGAPRDVQGFLLKLINKSKAAQDGAIARIVTNDDRDSAHVQADIISNSVSQNECAGDVEALETIKNHQDAFHGKLSEQPGEQANDIGRMTEQLNDVKILDQDVGNATKDTENA